MPGKGFGKLFSLLTIEEISKEDLKRYKDLLGESGRSKANTVRLCSSLAGDAVEERVIGQLVQTLELLLHSPCLSRLFNCLTEPISPPPEPAVAVASFQGSGMRVQRIQKTWLASHHDCRVARGSWHYTSRRRSPLV